LDGAVPWAFVGARQRIGTTSTGCCICRTHGRADEARRSRGSIYRTREEDVIHHLFIAAQDAMHATEVLAELVGGAAVMFPAIPGSSFAHRLDEGWSSVELEAAGTEGQLGGAIGGQFLNNDARACGSIHFLLGPWANNASQRLAFR
jgi:hypothetical protein